MVLSRTKKQVSLGCLSQSKYDVIVSRLKNEFKVPERERTPIQRKALSLFRKRRMDFTLDRRCQLLCHGKVVIPSERLPVLVKKSFIDSQGCGPRTLYNKMKDKYTGFSIAKVADILAKGEYFHRQFPRFANKPVPKTVTCNKPGHRWQIDLISMANSEVKYRNENYKYILQIVDVYSRYMMPQPLKSKKSIEIAIVLEKVILEHGAPVEIQCDNGKEFQGPAMKILFDKFEIKIIHGRPYHPQSQGKCERSNRILRQRISFACTNRSGFNWVESLPKTAHEINTSVKRVLGNVTPFHAYYGRAHYNTGDVLGRDEVRKRIKQAHKRIRSQILKNAQPPSRYAVGERVLIRYPFSRARVPTRRHILKGVVLKRSNGGGRYFMIYRKPNSKEIVRNWVGVENLTSVTIQKERQKQKNKNTVGCEPDVRNKRLKQIHKKKYYQVLSHSDNLDMLNQSSFADGVTILHDPKPDGNCQFDALSHQLSLIRIFRSNKQLREEAVDHLRKNRQFYESFVHDSAFGDYIMAMSQDGTYGDHLTLVALMREYNLQCVVMSPRGFEYSSLVSNDGIYNNTLRLVTLVHFPEDAGMHYISVGVRRNVISEFQHVLVSNTVDLEDALATSDGGPEEEPATSDDGPEEEPATSDDGHEEEPATSDEGQEEEPATSDEGQEEEPATSDDGHEYQYIILTSSPDDPDNQNLTPNYSNDDPFSTSPAMSSKGNTEPQATSTDCPEGMQATSTNDLHNTLATSPATSNGYEEELATSSNNPESSIPMVQATPANSPVNKQGTSNSGPEKVSALCSLRGMVNRERDARRKKKVAFPFFRLPLHIQKSIVEMIVHENPSIRFVLEQAHSLFRQLIRTLNIPRPQIYISSTALQEVPAIVSVRLLSRRAGRASGLLLKLRKIIKNNNWMNAWLRLHMCGIGWFDIVDIFYH